MLTVANEEMPKNVPILSATFPIAFSPWWWNRRCKAVGEKNKGKFMFCPMIETLVSISSTPLSTLGTKSHDSKESVFLARVVSSSAPPSK